MYKNREQNGKLPRDEDGGTVETLFMGKNI